MKGANEGVVAVRLMAGDRTALELAGLALWSGLAAEWQSSVSAQEQTASDRKSSPLVVRISGWGAAAATRTRDSAYRWGVRATRRSMALRLNSLDFSIMTTS